jgi:hypothetical protein
MVRYRLRTLMIVLALGPQGRAAWFTALFVTAWIIAAISWPLAVFYMFKTVANRRPGLRLWHDAPTLFGAEPWWMRNPFNHICVTDNLTEEGIRCRRRLIYAVLCFVLPIVSVLLIGALTDQLD